MIILTLNQRNILPIRHHSPSLHVHSNQSAICNEVLQQKSFFDKLFEQKKTHWNVLK